MNESETKFEAMNDPENAELRADVQSLRFMLSLTLLLAFVFSFFVFVYLRNQNSVLTTQVAQEQQMIALNTGPAAELYNRLGDYARSHPDYAPIFQKYSQSLSLRTNAAPAVKK